MYGHFKKLSTALTLTEVSCCYFACILLVYLYIFCMLSYVCSLFIMPFACFQFLFTLFLVLLALFLFDFFKKCFYFLACHIMLRTIYLCYLSNSLLQLYALCTVVSHRRSYQVPPLVLSFDTKDSQIT